MMTISRIQPWRKLAQILQGAFVLGLPFLRISGQSALRFDIPSLRLYFFGVSLWMDEFFIVLAAVIFLVLFFVFITFMLGRIWCGWICPQTVLIDYTGFLNKPGGNKNLFYRAAGYVAVLLISVVIAASLIWYFVSPYEFFAGLLGSGLGATIEWFWGVLSGVLFLDLSFLRHKWCATVCPYAKLQSIMFDSKTLVIAFNPERKEECMDCMACVRTCPVGIDIRKGLDPTCINCAKCIDECAKMTEPRGRKGLIGYFWGLPGEAPKKGLRTNALITGFAAAASFLFVIYLAATRTAIGLEVLPNNDFPARVVNGKAVNSYLLSIENRGRKDEEFAISVSGLENGTVTPARIFVKKGAEENVPVYVLASEEEDGETEAIELEIASQKTGEKTEGKASFVFPATR